MNSSLWKQVLQKKAALFSLVVIFAFGAVALLTPWITPYDPYKMNLSASNLPPMWVQNPIKPGIREFPIGTDYYGRDVFSRILHGTRTAFFLALTAVPLAAVTGTLAGLVAGYAGGRLDAIILFFTDMILSLPGLMFVVIIILIFRNIFPPSWFHGSLTLVIGYAAISWASLARLVRINVMLIKTQLFIEAATSLGAPPLRIILHHVLPNVQHVILVWMINNIPAIILLEAVLGYIGVGITSAIDGGEFTVASWGGMFFSGRTAMSRNPFMLIVPSLCILLLSMSFILLADVLSEANRQKQEFI
jgi:oligopeptide transport system permease protein